MQQYLLEVCKQSACSLAAGTQAGAGRWLETSSGGLTCRSSMIWSDIALTNCRDERVERRLLSSGYGLAGDDARVVASSETKTVVNSK